MNRQSLGLALIAAAVLAAACGHSAPAPAPADVAAERIAWEKWHEETSRCNPVTSARPWGIHATPFRCDASTNRCVFDEEADKKIRKAEQHRAELARDFEHRVLTKAEIIEVAHLGNEIFALDGVTDPQQASEKFAQAMFLQLIWRLPQDDTPRKGPAHLPDGWQRRKRTIKKAAKEESGVRTLTGPEGLIVR